MANYIYKISTVKYGTPTGLVTMPVTLVTLPYTVKGSVKLTESDSTTEQFDVDQLTDPVMLVVTKTGSLTATMQFYDMDYEGIAALKGGVGDVDGYSPAIGGVNILKAIQINTVSGHKFDFFNAHVLAKMGGAQSSDGLFTLDVTITALATLDGLGSWHVGPIA